MTIHYTGDTPRYQVETDSSHMVAWKVRCWAHTMDALTAKTVRHKRWDEYAGGLAASLDSAFGTGMNAEQRKVLKLTTALCEMDSHCHVQRLCSPIFRPGQSASSMRTYAPSSWRRLHTVGWKAGDLPPCAAVLASPASPLALADVGYYEALHQVVVSGTDRSPTQTDHLNSFRPSIHYCRCLPALPKHHLLWLS